MKHFVDRYNMYFAYGPTKVEKEVHGTAINYVIVCMFLLQINLLAYVNVHLEATNKDDKGVIQPQMKGLKVFSVIGFCITAALFMGQVFFNMCANFSPILYKVTLSHKLITFLVRYKILIRFFFSVSREYHKGISRKVAAEAQIYKMVSPPITAKLQPSAAKSDRKTLPAILIRKMASSKMATPPNARKDRIVDIFLRYFGRRSSVLSKSQQLQLTIERHPQVRHHPWSVQMSPVNR